MRDHPGPLPLRRSPNLRFECVQQITHQLDQPTRVLPVDGREQGEHLIRQLEAVAGRRRIGHADEELLADPMNR